MSLSGTPSVSSSTSKDGPSNNSSKDVLEDDWGLTTDLKQLLECPVCENTAIPPIFLCLQGHIVCHICRGNVAQCPSCDSEYTTMRNDLAESILGKCTFRCLYFDQGCKSTFKGNEISRHFEECDYRPVKCNIFGENGKACEKSVNYKEHVHHMKNDHGVVGIQGSSAVIGMSTTVKLGQGNWTFPAHFMNTFGETFWCNLHASFNLLIAWVSMSGTMDELEEYAAAITIFDPNKKWQQAKWIGQVHSIRSSAKEVYDSGNCLALLPESFLLLSHSNVDEEGRKIKRWRCHFEIIQIEEKSMFTTGRRDTKLDEVVSEQDGAVSEDTVELNPEKSFEYWASIEDGTVEVNTKGHAVETEEEGDLGISVGSVIVESNVTEEEKASEQES